MGEPAVDDRGQRVKLVFVGGYPARLWSRVSRMPPDVHRRLRERMEHGTGSVTGPTVIMCIVLFGGWLVIAIGLRTPIVSTLKPITGLFLASMLTSLVPQLTAIALLALWGQRRFNRRLIDGAVSLGHCPSCGYMLKDLPIDRDGCATCPECGSAWRPRA